MTATRSTVLPLSREMSAPGSQWKTGCNLSNSLTTFKKQRILLITLQFSKKSTSGSGKRTISQRHTWSRGRPHSSQCCKELWSLARLSRRARRLWRESCMILSCLKILKTMCRMLFAANPLHHKKQSNKNTIGSTTRSPRDCQNILRITIELLTSSSTRKRSPLISTIRTSPQLPN